MSIVRQEMYGADDRDVLTGTGVLILLVPPAVKLLMHLLVIGGYGLHGDELYYLACSVHLDWGYVDQPPLSLFLLHIQRVLFDDSLVSIRILSAVCGFFTVFLTGLLARKMGAGVFGRLFAEICVLISPVYMAENHYYSMNAFDVLFWVAALYVIVDLIEGGKPSLWLWFGVVMGAGFENKISVLFLAFGLGVGLLLTKERRILFSRWIWAGAAAAIVLMIPHVIWQYAHGWPTLEFIHNARAYKMAAMPVRAFMFEQVMLDGPLNVIVWGTGLIALLFYPPFSRFRSIGLCYIAVLALFLLQGGKPYYLAPIYPALFAAGAMMVEKWVSRTWARAGAAVLFIAAGALTAPFGMPVLPVDSFIRYQHAIRLRPPSGEKNAEGELPSFFASMFGWEDLVSTVDSVYRSLPPEDRAGCGIFCPNYAVAGANDFYGRGGDLPRAICGHNSYWLWGMGPYTGDVLIIVGGNAGDLNGLFGDVSERARFRHPYVQPQYDGLRLFVVRKPKLPPGLLWQRVKMYI